MNSEKDLDERIARQLESWQAKVSRPGRPLVIDEAWLQTPPALRMAFQVLKNAGIPPPEVELMQERAALAEALEACTDPGRQRELRRQLSDLEQALAWRLEQLQRMARET